MKKLKKLTLNKQNVISLEKNEQEMIQGGWTDGACTNGCSDGCLSAIAHTRVWNCSEAACTADCGYCGDPTWTGSGACPTL